MKFKRTLFICSLYCLLLSVAACASRPASESGGSTAPASGGSSGGSSAAVLSASDKPLDALTKAMHAQLDAKSFRAHMTSSHSDGKTSKMLVEYVAPDRYRMVNEGQDGDAGKGFNVEYIIVGGATYMKIGNGNWAKSPVDAGAIVKGFRDPKMLEELAKKTDIKFLGAETLDGTPMLVYQYEQDNPLGMQVKTTSKSWLSVADGRLRQTESEGEFKGVKSKTLVTITDYNADIRIESPLK